MLISLFWMLLRKLLQRLVKNVQSDFFIIEWLKARTFYKKNLLIFLQESAIELSLSAGICIANISEAHFYRLSDGFSTVLALLIGPIVLIVPIYLIRAKKRYQEEIFVRKETKFYADFFPNLRPEEPMALYYSTVFLMRRLLIISVAVLSGDETLIQLYSQIILSLLHCSFVFAAQPFDTPLKNKLENFNETMVIISSYHMLFYTAFIPEKYLKEDLGKSNMGCLGIIFLVNLTLMAYIWTRGIIIKCK